jgi:hypothetical protein
LLISNESIGERLALEQDGVGAGPQEPYGGAQIPGFPWLWQPV